MPDPSKSGWSRNTKLLVYAAVTIGTLFFLGRLAEIPWRSALRGWDNSFYYFWLRSAVEDRDWDFANEIALNNTIAPEDWEDARNLPPTDVDRTPNKYGIGWALASLPFYLLAKAFVTCANLAGAGWANDGFSAPFQIAQQVGHLGYAALGLFLLYRCLRDWIGAESSARGLAAGWLATPLIYYQSTNLSMSHNLVFTLVAAALYVAWRIRHQPLDLRLWAALGAICGLCAITRYQAVLGLLPSVWMATVALWRSHGNQPLTQIRVLSAAAATATCFIGLQMFAWWRVYGTPLIFTYGEAGEGFQWNEPALGAVLFSPFHGAFYWHPILLAAAAAWILPRLVEPMRELRWPLLAAAASTWYLYASWWVWSLGASFGYRGFDVLWPYALAGLGVLSARATNHARTARVSHVLAALLILWNVLLCLTYVIGLTDRNGPVTYADMLAAMLEVPDVLLQWMSGWRG